MRHLRVAGPVAWSLVLILGIPLAAGPAGAPEERPKYGGSLVKTDIYGDPQNLDPMVGVRVATIMVTMNIYDGLVKFDPVRGRIIPDIAERWTTSPDGRMYTFTLRRGVLFHNGREVTAEDFKYSFERIAHPDNASPYLPRLALLGVSGVGEYQAKRAREITGLRVRDKYTLEVALDKPNCLFIYDLGSAWASVVPREEVERLGREFGSRPVGSGPFVFDSWVRDSQVVLRKFDKYWRTDRWGNKLPYLDRVTFRVIKEMATTEAEFEAGNLDFSVMLDPQYRKYKQHPVYKNHIIEVAELFTRHIGFNLDAPGRPWQDKRVRQAINHAIDRAAIVEKVLHGKAFPAVGILPPTIAGHNRNLRGYDYNVDKAKRLLAEAGVGGGFAARIITTDHPAWGLPAVEAVMGYLVQVGIRLEPELMEGATLIRRMQEGQFEWFISSTGGDTHPLAYLQRRFHSRQAGPPGNYARYRNRTVDDLLDRAAEDTRCGDAMISLLRQAEAIIVDEAPWWFYNYNKAVIAHQPYVRGLKPVPTDIDYQDLDEVWFTSPPPRRR
ncbi:MAG: ABC transporter substrate-binding protein [Armatimonadota bacterium]|nr:ABC transporter substrate-binding protein [Armatimonadota bacterium]MDR7533167.1 ABC transporter substrate-binding protein [Armatimonadota bacterium]